MKGRGERTGVDKTRRNATPPTGEKGSRVFSGYKPRGEDGDYYSERGEEERRAEIAREETGERNGK